MEIVRWMLVLPVAIVAGIAVREIGGTIAQSAMSLVGAGIRESSAAEWVYMVVYYVVSQAAFVIAGAKTAPRRASATAVTLMMLGIGLSLVKHVIGQQLAGNRVGTTNYLHAGLETAGLIGGAVFIFVSVRKTQRAVGT
jgi:hypothetical protein